MISTQHDRTALPRAGRCASAAGVAEMRPLWAILIILAAFGIVGRIDYEVAMDAAQTTATTYARSSNDR